MTPIEELIEAAKAVIARWDSTDWKAPPTAEVMNRLRNALVELSRREAEAVKPSGQHYWWCPECKEAAASYVSTVKALAFAKNSTNFKGNAVHEAEKAVKQTQESLNDSTDSTTAKE